MHSDYSGIHTRGNPIYSENVFPLFLRKKFGFIFAAASAVSGFFASACSLPFDYVKTQIQKMQPDAQGKYPFTGPLDCAFKTIKTHGPLKFYSGFGVYCVRIAPHVMVTNFLLIYSNHYITFVGFIIM